MREVNKMEDVLNVGLIGVGNMGSSHLAMIAGGMIDGMRATAVCDIDSAKLERVGREYPNIELFDSSESLLDAADIDAVIIAVPHPSHADIAISALEHGKHVLVEKPIDISVSKAEMLNSAARKSGRVFGIMFNQRTNDLFREAHRIVHSGELGDIKRSVWIITNWYRTQSYYDSGDWRATWSGEGGGVLLNQAVHNLDLWQWICGMPTAITAFCRTGKYHNIEVEDEATILCEYENGASGVFITSTGDLPGSNRLEIVGTLGKLVIEGGVMKQYKLRTDERELCFGSRDGFISPETDVTEYKSMGETAHRGILQNFANAVLRGEELIAPGFDGINELMISNAAYLSEWLGNKRIELPFDKELFDSLLSEKRRSSSRIGKRQDAEPDSAEHRAARWQVNW